MKIRVLNHIISVGTSYSRFLLMSCIMSIVLLSVGCETLENLRTKTALKDEAPEYVLSIHSIVKYPRAKMLEKEISTFDGEKIWINKNPFLHSRDITKIELVKREDPRLSKEQELYGREEPAKTSKNDENTPKYYDLKLYLTRRGTMAWMQVSVGFRHEKLALIIDGIYYRSFYPGKMTSEEDEFVIIEGPIDGACAKAIERKAKFNYKHFNKKRNPELF